MAFSRSIWVASSLLCALAGSISGCNTMGFNDPPAGGTGGTGPGGATDTIGGGGSTSTGGSSDCPQANTMLDVSKAPGAGAQYPHPTLSAACVGDKFVVDSNDIPHYTFVQTTPNPLTGATEHYEIPRNPQYAEQTTSIPLLGVAGFAVNGLPFFGPNEAAQPADEAYGDPVYNGLMDACLGHTSPGEYHYHSMSVKCLDENSLVSEPWMNADPAADKASPVIGWALDGFPIYGPIECADAACASTVTLQSGYDKVGDPKSHAWDAYQWGAHADDPKHLDACNGHKGPNGDYHYHATETFPYILGCYHGVTDGSGGGGTGGGGAGGGGTGGTGGGGMGPQSCQTAADCNGACPPGSKGCTCASSPMGMICVPTCTTSADCPVGPNGQSLNCNMGICVP